MPRSPLGEIRRVRPAGSRPGRPRYPLHRLKTADTPAPLALKAPAAHVAGTVIREWSNLPRGSANRGRRHPRSRPTPPKSRHKHNSDVHPPLGNTQRHCPDHHPAHRLLLRRLRRGAIGTLRRDQARYRRLGLGHDHRSPSSDPCRRRRQPIQHPRQPRRRPNIILRKAFSDRNRRSCFV